MTSTSWKRSARSCSSTSRVDAHRVEIGGTKSDEDELTEGELASGGEGVARVDARAQLAAGRRVSFQLDPDRIHFFDATTGEAIAN